MSVTFPTSPQTGTTPEDETKSASTEGEGAEKPKETKTNEPRNYDIHVRVTGTVDAIAKKLAEYITSGKGEVLVKLGTESALQPKLAMKKYGDGHELDGDYEVAAERAFAKFPGLKTESVTKTKIKGL